MVEREVERARELQRLAGVARLDARELVRALLEQVGQPVEHGGALGRGRRGSSRRAGRRRGRRRRRARRRRRGRRRPRRAARRWRVDDRARATALQRLAVHEHPPRTHVVSDGHATPPLRPSTLSDPAGCRNGRIGVCSECQRAATALAAGGERGEHGSHDCRRHGRHRLAAGAGAPPPADALHPQRRVRARRQAAAGARARRGRRTSSTPTASATSTGSRRCSAARSATRSARRWRRSRPSSCRRWRSTRTGRTAHPPAIELAAALAERAPGDLNRVFFTNGGSESVEAAWKIVRQHYLAKGEPQRTKAIAREIAYHGVTLGALSFTGVRPMKEPFGAAADPGRARLQHQPLPGDPTATTTPRSARGCWTRWSGRSSRPGPETVAMIIAEPVQNAGGCLVPPDGLLARPARARRQVRRSRSSPTR